MKSVDVVHALRYPNGMYVALDQNNGGYPYRVRASKAHDFGSEGRAEEYQQMFHNLDLEVTLLEVFDHFDMVPS